MLIALRTRLAAEQGLTLIELLVAMVAGIVICGALLTVMEVSLKQNARISDQVQSNRIGRLALANMTEEIRSTCTGWADGGVQAPSGTVLSPLAATGIKNLWFITAYGSASSQNPYVEKATLHDLNWAESATERGEKLGTLTDYSWNSTNTGTKVPPNEVWKFSGTLSTATAEQKRVLAKNVLLSESALFRYWKYDTVSTDSTYGELVEIKASELPLTTSNASNVAKIEFAFRQAPEGGDVRTGHTTTFSDAVSLRLSPTESRGEGGECS